MTRPELVLDFKKQRMPSRLGLLLLAIGLAAGTLAFADYRSATEELIARQRALDGVQRAIRPTHTSPLPAADPKHMNLVVDRLTLPWEGFFDALESAATEHATLLSIAPDSSKRTVQVRGEARDIGAVVHYIGKLESGGFFSHVDLVEHELGTQNADLPLRFLVTARWNPASERR